MPTEHDYRQDARIDQLFDVGGELTEELQKEVVAVSSKVDTLGNDVGWLNTLIWGQITVNGSLLLLVLGVLIQSWRKKS